MSIAASNRQYPVPCTSCPAPIAPPELPVLSWDDPHQRNDDGSRPDPDHVEHLVCYMRRVPRLSPVPARGAAA